MDQATDGQVSDKSLVAKQQSQKNSLVIDGFIRKIDTTRYTAAGEPVIKFILEHASQSNDVSRREVNCQIGVQLIGKPLCRSFEGFALDDLISVKGFLTRNSYREELSWVIIEALAIKTP